MGKINSRQKGAAGEREFRDVLRAEGFEAKRGQQHAGGADSPDVVCPSLPDIHWEVKRVENLNVVKALFEQAIPDAGPNKIPIVAHRKNGQKQWAVTMLIRDFFRIRRGDTPGDVRGFPGGQIKSAQEIVRALVNPWPPSQSYRPACIGIHGTDAYCPECDPKRYAEAVARDAVEQAANEAANSLSATPQP